MAIEQRMAELEGELTRTQAHTAQIQADESAALNALTTEQQRWSDFNQRLEALEQTIGSAARPPR